MLKQCQRLENYQNVKAMKLEGVWGELESEKKIPETTTHKIFET